MNSEFERMALKVAEGQEWLAPRGAGDFEPIIADVAVFGVTERIFTWDRGAPVPEDTAVRRAILKVLEEAVVVSNPKITWGQEISKKGSR